MYPSDLEGLTCLNANGRSIADLTGLEYVTDLTYLNLYNDQISDISPLVDNSGLGDGDEIDLRDNPLSDDSINIYTGA